MVEPHRQESGSVMTEVFKFVSDEKLSDTQLKGAARAAALNETGKSDWSVRAVDWYVDVMGENDAPEVVSIVWLQRTDGDA